MATSPRRDVEAPGAGRASTGAPIDGSPTPLRFSDGAHPHGLPPAWLLSFDVEAHSPAAFARADIDCPPAIARSVARRQCEFLWGRVAAREALRQLAAAPWRAPIGIGASRQPLWPTGVSGSISHAGGVAAAVAARADEWEALGLDIEEIAAGEALLAVTALSVDADEQALLGSAVGLRGLDEGITLAFSAKESLFKAAFAAVGRHFDFDTARLTAIDAPARQLTLTIATPLGGGYDVGRRCLVHFARPRPGMVMTLVAEPAARS